MNANEQAELAAVKRSMVMTQVVGLPGTVMIGFGIYGLWGNGRELHSFLADPINCYGLLAVGGLIALRESVKIIKLAKRRKQLEDQLAK